MTGIVHSVICTRQIVTVEALYLLHLYFSIQFGLSHHPVGCSALVSLHRPRGTVCVSLWTFQKIAFLTWLRIPISFDLGFPTIHGVIIYTLLHKGPRYKFSLIYILTYLSIISQSRWKHTSGGSNAVVALNLSVHCTSSDWIQLLSQKFFIFCFCMFPCSSAYLIIPKDAPRSWVFTVRYGLHNLCSEPFHHYWWTRLRIPLPNGLGFPQFTEFAAGCYHPEDQFYLVCHSKNVLSTFCLEQPEKKGVSIGAIE